MYGELKSPQVTNIAEGEKRFRGKSLLDGISISKIKGMNEMAYVCGNRRVSATMAS